MASRTKHPMTVLAKTRIDKIYKDDLSKSQPSNEEIIAAIAEAKAKGVSMNDVAEQIFHKAEEKYINICDHVLVKERRNFVDGNIAKARLDGDIKEETSWESYYFRFGFSLKQRGKGPTGDIIERVVKHIFDANGLPTKMISREGIKMGHRRPDLLNYEAIQDGKHYVLSKEVAYEIGTISCKSSQRDKMNDIDDRTTVLHLGEIDRRNLRFMDEKGAVLIIINGAGRASTNRTCEKENFKIRAVTIDEGILLIKQRVIKHAQLVENVPAMAE